MNLVLKEDALATPVQRTARLDTLQIETTNRCQAHCVFCPVPTLKRERGVMEMRLFKKIIDDCAKMDVENVLPFLNGEPFLDPLIFERIAYVNEKLPHAKVSMYSNANLLTEEKVEKLAALRISQMNFSVNAACEETRMALMGLPLQPAVENIFRYKDMDPTVKIAASLILDPAYMDGTEAQGFQLFWQPRGVIPRIFLPGNWAGTLRPSYSTKSVCCRPEGHMTVLYTGEVCLCCFDSEGKKILGDLNSQSVRQVWESEEFERYRKLNKEGRRNELELCGTCTTI